MVTVLVWKLQYLLAGHAQSVLDNGGLIIIGDMDRNININLKININLIKINSQSKTILAGIFKGKNKNINQIKH